MHQNETKNALVSTIWLSVSFWKLKILLETKFLPNNTKNPSKRQRKCVKNQLRLTWIQFGERFFTFFALESERWDFCRCRGSKLAKISTFWQAMSPRKPKILKKSKFSSQNLQNSIENHRKWLTIDYLTFLQSLKAEIPPQNKDLTPNFNKFLHRH